ncbi:MAG: PD40 domain-containing protein [Planctomycetes bacterium]|nr:PD40 domain-containing protein [Planctomycetota bacterium]
MLFLLLFTSSLNAQSSEPIRFARTPDISPDGKQVAFSYLGDLWIVDAKGGVARHLTMHEKHDFAPLFSPDGKWIAFSSNRHGQYDVFVIPVQGGKPKRLTFDSADDVATCWSADGKQILFTSTRQTDFPQRQEIFVIPATGGQARRISVHEGREGAFSPKGDLIAYVRGPGTWYRKGYRGSANDDIWICNADGTNNRQITTFNGQDNHPQWSPAGKTLYWVSETFGTPANIIKQEFVLNGSASVASPPQQVTHHKDDGVRRARLCANGEWMVYECGPDLYLLEIKTGSTRKLNIEVYADDKTNPERLVTFTSGATEFSLSHDEKAIAFVVHGEIFVMPRNGGKAKRLTDSPAFDHGVAWSPDNKKLLFLSDRGGHEDIYLLESDDTEHPELIQAHRFKVKQLTNTPEAEMGVMFTPDGKRASFLRAGKLMTMNPDGTDQKVLVKDGQIFDYEWSPDGKWLVYGRSDSSFASELFIVPGTGPTAADPPRNITRFATYNGGVTWSKTGNRLAFISSRRRNQTTAHVLSLQKPAAPGAPASKDIDWDDIHLRVKQPAPLPAGECAISNDGSRIAFRATVDGASDLWVASSDGGQIARLSTGNVNPHQIQWSKNYSSMIFFRDGGGNIRTATVGPPVPSGIAAIPAPSATIPFQARMTVRQDEVFAEIFAQSWRALNESFYDPLFHGANWNKVRDKYRPLVKHVALKEDLFTMISLMLGELNASHLGISGNLGAAEQQTADLGLIFDDAYKGPGLKLAEILRNGPADRRGLSLKPAEIVLRIDDVELKPNVDGSKLLNDKIGEVVTLSVTGNPDDPRATRRLELQGVNRQEIAKLMYERWVKKNADRVHEISKGKLGYIHIPSMDENGLDRFLRSLYSDCFDKDGIVLDVRYNGGGFTHEQVLSYLTGKEHTFFHQRNGPSGLVLNSNDRRWTKPLVLLVNNRSYSDAEIFPHAFRTMGLGKLVGQPTGGHVIGTRNIQLIDGTTFRTPRIGVTTNKGVNMDKEGVTPDIVVDVHPDQLARGHDPQLEKAVDVILQDVAAIKKTKGAVVSSANSVKPGLGPLVSPAPESTPPPMPPAKD